MEKILPYLPRKVPAGRVFGWNSQRVKRRPCPVCGEDKPDLFVKRPDGLGVHECANCHMLYLSDAPLKEDIDRIYRNYCNWKTVGVSAIRTGWLRREFAACRNPFISLLDNTGGIKGRSICEIGCSSGELLFLLRHRGALVTGVEIDVLAAKYLRHRGIPVYPQIEMTLKFDVVCLLQVLEHMLNPHEVLSVVAKVLPHDGRVLISVPNAGEAAKLGAPWVGFRVDLEHLNYFNLQTLSRLLYQQGLFVEHYWEHSQPSLISDSKESVPGTGVIQRKLRAGVQRLTRTFSGSDCFTSRGSFVLTVLARKS